MAENEKASNQEKESNSAKINPISKAETKNPSIDSTHKENGANSTNNGGQPSIKSAHSLLGYLTINEWLTFLIAVGSLVVSYMTYRTANETSDIKAAVTNLRIWPKTQNGLLMLLLSKSKHCDKTCGRSSI